MNEHRPAVAIAPSDAMVVEGLWRERGGLDNLVRLACPAVTPGMVVVAGVDEHWQANPHLRWQVWPDDLELQPTGVTS